jgi:hypothetical protein
MRLPHPPSPLQLAGSEQPRPAPMASQGRCSAGSSPLPEVLGSNISGWSLPGGTLHATSHRCRHRSQLPQKAALLLLKDLGGAPSPTAMSTSGLDAPVPRRTRAPQWASWSPCPPSRFPPPSSSCLPWTQPQHRSPPVRLSNLLLVDCHAKPS